MAITVEDDTRTQILQSGWLAAQSDDFRALVVGNSRVVERLAGDIVIRFGDMPVGLYGIAAGAIGVHVPTPEGRATLASIGRRGDWFGQTPLFGGRPSTLTFSVIEDATLLFLPMARAQAIIARKTEWMRAFYAVSSYGAENAIANVGTLLVRNPTRRIAATLLRIAPQAASDASVTVVVSQDQLGEIANAARDVVNRALKRFAAEGWISVGYRSVTILRQAEMAGYVQSGG